MMIGRPAVCPACRKKFTVSISDPGAGGRASEQKKVWSFDEGPAAREKTGGGTASEVPCRTDKIPEKTEPVESGKKNYLESDVAEKCRASERPETKIVPKKNAEFVPLPGLRTTHKIPPKRVAKGPVPDEKKTIELSPKVEVPGKKRPFIRVRSLLAAAIVLAIPTFFLMTRDGGEKVRDRAPVRPEPKEKTGPDRKKIGDEKIKEAENLIKRNEIEKAFAILDKVFDEKKPGFTRARLLKIQVLLEKDKLERAEREYFALYSVDPSHRDVFAASGAIGSYYTNAVREADTFDEKITLLEKFLRLNPFSRHRKDAEELLEQLRSSHPQ